MNHPIGVLVGLAAIAVGAGAAESLQPSLTVEPAQCLIDERVVITAAGLEAGKAASVRATMTDARGRQWQSHATFVADAAGKVNLSTQAPRDGSYKGVDGMGLLWSMQLAPGTPEDKREPTMFSFDTKQPPLTKFELEIDGRSAASCQLERRGIDPKVTMREVKQDGLVGELYLPPGKGPHPALIVLTGSDGGINRNDAGLLASRGFAAFALAYFRADGLPSDLVEIPLDYMKKGLDWFRRQEGVAADKLGVIGGSKGGELGLLMAANFPEIRCVVAYVPSHVVWQGISMSGPPPDKSSWTFQGQPIPYLRGKPTQAFYAQFATPGNPLKLLDLYASALDDVEAVERAAIPVERINGPVLLVSGKADDMWPCTVMADRVIDRLKKHNHPHAYDHLSYEHAGHAIRKSFLPAAGTTATRQLAMGGTEEANAKAQADSWPKVLQFLNRSLR